MEKEVKITMSVGGHFSVKANVSTAEAMGFLDVAKETLMRDFMNPKERPIEKPVEMPKNPIPEEANTLPKEQ